MQAGGSPPARPGPPGPHWRPTPAPSASPHLLRRGRAAPFAFHSPSPLSALPQAACCIVSSRSNAHLDAYVLSESSLFVYPNRLVLKTCGTTRLLAAVPGLLAAAAGVRLAPCRVKYSRASFLFPAAQPAPHTDFASESATLRTHFGHLGGGGAA